MTSSGDVGDALRRLSAMVAQIDVYLEGGTPYREIAIPRPGGGTQPGTMSVGLMLDAVDVLHAAGALEPIDQAELSADLAALAAARNRPEYGRILRRELHGQLEAWRWFLDECTADEAGCSDGYPSEVRKRSRIAQLLVEADRIGLDVRQERAQTAELDGRLRGILGPYRAESSGDRPAATESGSWWLDRRPGSRQMP